MSQKRLFMRKIRELMRLKHELGRSHREIAASLGVANSTVSDYVRRAVAAGLSWPLPEGLDDAALEAALFPALPPSRVPRPEPDWQYVHRELQRHKGVTLRLLWLEYRTVQANGYQYSRFCDRYREWRGHLDVVMRQVYRAGEKAFVDYAGPKFPVVDRSTGEVRDAMVFAGVLAASNYTFVDMTWSRAAAGLGECPTSGRSMEWTPPTPGAIIRRVRRTHTGCVRVHEGGRSMGKVVSVIGIDISKRYFQLHGATADGEPVLRRKLTRSKVLAFLAGQPACRVVMEVCGSAHHWGRMILWLGHEVCLIPPVYVKPYVKRQKNDANDAGAIVEAAQRPTMRFVAVRE